MKIFVTIAALLTLVACGAIAQWSGNPNADNPISIAARNQVNPVMCSDGAGGAIIAWEDNRVAPYSAIYAQRIGVGGIVKWTTNGINVKSAPNNGKYTPRITSDGAGGAIIAWYDNRFPGAGIYAQRVDANGLLKWTSSGVQVLLTVEPTNNYKIVSDNAGGAVIVWNGSVGGSEGIIYAQRVKSNGSIAWTGGYVQIYASAGNVEQIDVASDGAGGAITTWREPGSTGFSRIDAQWINASGGLPWGASPIIVADDDNDGNAINPVLCSDGAGGAYVAWHDYRSSDAGEGVYVQHLFSNGSVLWAPDGTYLVATIVDGVAISSDGVQGAIIAWMDFRSGTHYDIYARRIDRLGNLDWPDAGNLVCSSGQEQEYPVVAGDGNGGAFISWEDLRNGYDRDIYVQHMGVDGSTLWLSTGVAVSTAANDQTGPAILADNSGGTIITWTDVRNGSSNTDIFADKVDHYGYLGDASPFVAAVKDVPNDQGGNVTLLWNHSYLDVWPNQIITSYQIWRGVGPGLGAHGVPATLPREKYLTMAAKGMPMSNVFATMPSSTNSTSPIYWQSVDSVAPHWLSGYSYKVTLPADSGPQGIPMYYFMITAHTSDPLTFWDSQPDSGYSVDNLPPTPPPGSTISSLNNGLIQLNWNRDRADADVGCYYIYRSTTSGFQPDETTHISTTNDTTKIDSTAIVDQQYYYKVATVDVHGNVSKPSAELAATAVSFQLASLSIDATSKQGVLLGWAIGPGSDSYTVNVQRRKTTETEFVTLPNSSIYCHASSAETQHYSFADQSVLGGQWAYRLMGTKSDGSIHYSAVMSIDLSNAIPTEFSLEQNFPNPFNPTTQIRYAVPEASHVRLDVYDILGRVVATLVNEVQSPGFKSVSFTGANLPSGTYIYRVTAGKYSAINKMVLLK